MMRTLQIFVLCTISYVWTVNIFIDGPTVLLDCRTKSHGRPKIIEHRARSHMAERPPMVEATTASQITEEPVDQRDFYNAAGLGDLSFINAVISRLPISGFNLNWRNTDNRYGYTALHIAAETKKSSIIAILLDAGADPNMKSLDNGETPLYIATKHLRISVLRPLLDPKYQADVNLQNDDGKTPLYNAAQLGWTDALELLLAQGGDPNMGNNAGSSPLSIAANNGEVEAVRMLIEAGAKVNYVRPLDGSTALHWAAKHNEEDVALLLLQNGADKNKRDNDNLTPADWARKHRNYPLARLIGNY